MRAWICIVGLIASGMAASAQEVSRPRGGGMWRGGMGPGMGGPFLGRMAERMAEDLQLDETQRAQFDEIASAQRERMMQMREQFREMREAAEQGDMERVAELRASLPEGGPGAMMMETFDQLETILRDDQLPKLDEMRTRAEQRQAEMQRYRQIAEDLPDAVQMDEEQRRQYDDVLEDAREKMRERWQEMQPLFEEMRVAREEGDAARLAELEAEFEKTRPTPESMAPQFYENLAGILREDQFPLLAAFREQTDMQQREAQSPAAALDVRSVLRAARRLRLVDDQRSAFREIEQAAMRDARDVPRRDKDAQERLANDVKARILRILDPQQADEFEQALQRLSRPNRR